MDENGVKRGVLSLPDTSAEPRSGRPPAASKPGPPAAASAPSPRGGDAGDPRVYLGTLSGERKACEAWGGKWDPLYRSCYVPAQLDPAPFTERWGVRQLLTDRW